MDTVSEHPISLRGRLRATARGRFARLAAWAVVVAIVAAWAITLRPGYFGGPATYLIVSGQSMEPTLDSGELVLARRQQTYRRGDVIVYRIKKNQAGAGALVIHRIVGGSARDGYITRGDNRSYRDPWRPRPADIAGKMELHVPHLGLLPIFAHTGLGMALISAIAGSLVLGGSKRRDELPDGDAARVGGTVAAGLFAREMGLKGGRSTRVLPFGYVAHDEAADPAAGLDAAMTMTAGWSQHQLRGLDRHRIFDWGECAWTARDVPE